MKRMTLAALAVVLACVCAGLHWAAVAHAAVDCDGTLTGTVFDDVTVPAGATCNLGANVYGSVNVGAGGTLNTAKTVFGSVNVAAGGKLNLTPKAHVYGAVNAGSAASVSLNQAYISNQPFVAGGTVTLVGSTINGDANCATATSVTRSKTVVFGIDNCAGP